MGVEDVPLICSFDGELMDEDKDALRYIGGKTKTDKVPRSIGFASFREKILEMMNLPMNGMEFKVKCGLRFDEVRVIGIDVDDDRSLRSVMDDSKFVRAYIIKVVPPSTKFTNTQWEETQVATTYTPIEREDLVLPPKNLINGSSNNNPAEMNMMGVKIHNNDVMNTNIYASPTKNEFKEWFPEKLLRFITGHKNPIGDGNCGFRALCMAWGEDEEKWAWMREQLVKEIEENRDSYNQLFGVEETASLFERTRHSHVSNHLLKWMDMPSTGFVFAQAFEVVLVHYSKRNCWTFVPFRSRPMHWKVCGIGFVKNDHYIKLDFHDGCPLPPFPHIPSHWRKISPETTNCWEELLKPRLTTFINIHVPELQVDMGLGGPIIIDREETVPLSDDAFFQTSGPAPALIDSSGAVVVVGSEFPDVEAVRNAISDWAMKTGHEYRPVKKTPAILTMKCSSKGCKWRIHASRPRNLPTVKVRKYEKMHTCSGPPQRSCADGDHRQATTKWIVSKMQSIIEKNPDVEPKKIVKEIKKKFGIQISYNKAVKAKTRALETMRNLHISDHLPRLVKELEQGGSIGKLGLNPDGSFQYFFWAFSAYIHVLRSHLLRPVLFVRTAEIEVGVLICANRIDGKGFGGSPIHVAFAVFATEDDKAWEIFMGCLKEYILPVPPSPSPENSNFVPFAIVTDFKETATRAVANVLPDVHHFFFPGDLYNFFSAKLKNLGDLLYACVSYNPNECEEALQNIKSEDEEAYEWLLLSVGSSHWSVAFSPNKHVMADGGWDFYPELDLREAVSLSIPGIVEESRKLVAKYTSDRQIAAAEMTTGLAPGLMADVEWAKRRLPAYKVESVDGDKYQVTPPCNYDKVTRVVDLEKKTCSCCEFQATEYPCRHAFMAIITNGNLDVTNYISQRWYSADTYRATYAGSPPPPIAGISNLQTAKRTRGRPRKHSRVHL